jgi:hypothetical protein
MTKILQVLFTDMRRLLKSLGYKERLVDKAHAFVRTKKDMVIFRRYAEKAAMRSGDVASTRQYLDIRGILDEAKFDSFFEGVNKSA